MASSEKTQTRKLKPYDRVKVVVTDEKHGFEQHGKGTLQYFIPDSETTGWQKDHAGQWAVKLDDYIRINGREENFIFVNPDIPTPLKRDADPVFDKLQQTITDLFVKHGQQLVMDAYAKVAALSTECQKGHHQWGEEYGGYGGANERKDCQRPGCNAYVLD